MNLASILTPESRLLLATAAPEVDEEEVESLLEAASWPRLLKLMVLENSLPPAWDQLGRLMKERLPPEAETAFERAAANHHLFLTLLHQRLVDVLEVLEGADIDVLLLKGAALAHHGYGHFTERPMADLDLLVRREHAQRAWSLLRTAGWYWDAERYPAQRYGDFHHLPNLRDSQGTGVEVELHSAPFEPTHPFRFGSRDLWAGARELRVEGRRARVPLPAPHLLHLCVHFAWSHYLGWASWRTFRDLQVLIRMEGFHWQPFLEAARRSKTDRCTYWTLWLARSMARAPVPAWILEELRPPGLVDSVRDALARHYALGLLASEPTCPSVGLGHLLWSIGVRPGRDRRVPWPAAGDPGRQARGRGPFVEDPSGSGVLARVTRHARDRSRWLDYLRRVLRGANS